MQDLRRLIGSPSSLFVFEAAARLKSFTRAAAELGVSQAAVSASIKGLEAKLGSALFARAHKRIGLTLSGDQFYADVALGLSHIRRSAAALRAAPSDHQVTLSSSTAFASHWGLPRLPGFRALHPTIDLRLQTSDRDGDIPQDGATLGVRRGGGQWPPGDGYEAHPLADEVLLPVCSPAYHRAGTTLGDLRDLARNRLIHLEEPFRPRPTWREWFRHFGLDYQDEGDGLRLNDYALVVQAAIGAQGVALGWRHVVDHPLRQGLLVPAHPAEWATGNRFFLVSPPPSALSPNARQVRSWLLREAGADPHPRA